MEGYFTLFLNKPMENVIGYLMIFHLKLRTKLYPSALSFISVLLAIPYLSLAAASDNSTEPFQLGSTPYGVPFHEWLGKFWSYWLGIPNSQHPGVEYDPQKCPVNQGGPVWYLPDAISKGGVPYNKVEFSCEVPLGKAILLPISTGACWLNLPEFSSVNDKVSANPDVDAKLRKCAIPAQDNTELFHLNVDGVDVKDAVKNSRSTTSFFNITSPSDPVTSIFAGVNSGTSRAIADGYFLLLPPPSAGDHLIEFLVEDTIEGIKHAREGIYSITVK